MGCICWMYFWATLSCRGSASLCWQRRDDWLWRICRSSRSNGWNLRRICGLDSSRCSLSGGARRSRAAWPNDPPLIGLIPLLECFTEIWDRLSLGWKEWLLRWLRLILWCTSSRRSRGQGRNLWCRGWQVYQHSCWFIFKVRLGRHGTIWS